jgi:hypothetical protein
MHCDDVSAWRVYQTTSGHAGKQRRAIDEGQGLRLAPTTALVDAVRPQARTRATYTWPSLAIRPVAISSIVMTSQPEKPLSFGK